MSFSSEVKEELAKQFSKSRHCQLAELAGMLEMEGSYDKTSGQLRMDTDNILLKEKYIGLVQRAFAIDAGKTLEPKESEKILSALRWDVKKETPLNEQRADKADGNSSYDGQSYCYCFSAAAKHTIHYNDRYRLSDGCHDVLYSCRRVLPYPF